ncbi:hypothetical protein DCAR_0417218 [Daucus carota subsp. sativus]|uniref:25S rRNA (uridine-N(3))-methyltransferase BMT5-like domain-containing protein n=2 Tax=Daucus carota subsp. sativus TaxID=79200 RepID=A0AAF1AYL0_DAUCS|nr:hypothetical protein DCAR_0417218 [Daucus carota subsp. sativus]
MEFTLERKIKHYSNHHKILLVGEGDFSFSKCLANAFGSASNITATSLDSQASLMCNYTDATANIEELKLLGCTILHEVDASIMLYDYRLNHTTFDRIVFNFPHCGIFQENNASVIELHKGVVRGFLRNAIAMLAPNGQVHITHKIEEPYNRWGIMELAEQTGFCLLDISGFCPWEYAGYVNKRGAGSKCNESFPVGLSATFKFVKA